MRSAGDYFVQLAEQLILDILDGKEDGLTNQEIADISGLNPRINTQNGYISWTLLKHLVEQGRVEKIGRRYRRTKSA